MKASTVAPPHTPASGPPPLGPDDYDAQDAELDALRERDPQTPDWEFCEGFLAALVCSRRSLEPAEYWTVLLGADFNPMAHMEFVWRWRRRWAEVAAALDAPVATLDDERAYQPELLDARGALLALPEDERGQAAAAALPAYGQAWAAGFMTAVQAWPVDWQPPRHAEAARMLQVGLEAIERLTGDDADPPTLSMVAEDGPPSVSQRRLDELDEAIWALYDLRGVGKSLAVPVETLRKAPEPGRNDPCPCGSGLKYKKCHGA